MWYWGNTLRVLYLMPHVLVDFSTPAGEGMNYSCL